jgi:hypothetical protein
MSIEIYPNELYLQAEDRITRRVIEPIGATPRQLLDFYMSLSHIQMSKHMERVAELILRIETQVKETSK